MPLSNPRTWTQPIECWPADREAPQTCCSRVHWALAIALETRTFRVQRRVPTSAMFTKGTPPCVQDSADRSSVFTFQTDKSDSCSEKCCCLCCDFKRTSLKTCCSVLQTTSPFCPLCFGANCSARKPEVCNTASLLWAAAAGLLTFGSCKESTVSESGSHLLTRAAHCHVCAQNCSFSSYLQ